MRNETLIAPELRERLAKLGIEPVGGSAAEFGRCINSETERWSGLIRNLGLKAEQDTSHGHRFAA